METPTGASTVSSLFDQIQTLFSGTIAPAVAILVVAVLALTLGVKYVRRYL